MKMEFDIFNGEFFGALTFSLEFQRKAQVSVMYMRNVVFLLPSCAAGTRGVVWWEYCMQLHSNVRDVLAVGDDRLF